jgi:hypothetical protein
MFGPTWLSLGNGSLAKTARMFLELKTYIDAIHHVVHLSNQSCLRELLFLFLLMCPTDVCSLVIVVE